MKQNIYSIEPNLNCWTNSASSSWNSVFIAVLYAHGSACFAASGVSADDATTTPSLAEAAAAAASMVAMMMASDGRYCWSVVRTRGQIVAD